MKPASPIIFLEAMMNSGLAAQLDPQSVLLELNEKKPRRVTLVVLSGDMDRVMAAFIIATGAASMGMQVTMFFTFWGLNAIRRPGVRGKAKDWLRSLFGALNKPGAETLPLSRFHFWGLGTRMMRRVMRQHRMPGVQELMETAKDLDVKFIACTTTLGLMGIDKDTLIEGVDQLAGVSTYLAEAKDAQANLFI